MPISTGKYPKAKPELTQRDDSRYQGVLQGEACSEFSQEEDSIGEEVQKGNGNQPFMLSRWENNSDKELMQDNWEHMRLQKIGVKPLLREEDEWDKVSILNRCKKTESKDWEVLQEMGSQCLSLAKLAGGVPGI